MWVIAKTQNLIEKITGRRRLRFNKKQKFIYNKQMNHNIKTKIYSKLNSTPKENKNNNLLKEEHINIIQNNNHKNSVFINKAEAKRYTLSKIEFNIKGMNQNIVNEEVNKYVNNLFRSCDKNNKGYLTMEEFLKCENKNQENESQSETYNTSIEERFHRIDYDNSGFINKAEAKRYTLSKIGANIKGIDQDIVNKEIDNYINNLFRSCDHNNNGEISK